MKKLLKPEMEFIKFNTEDVITTSGDTYHMNDSTYDTTSGNAHDDPNYGAGSNPLWNTPI